MSQLPYVLYGWKVSYFTGKLYSYLKHKQIPFVENHMNLWTLYGVAKKQVGAVVMPVLRAPDGAWMQDTRHIINALEKTHPVRPVFPSTPKRRVVSSLVEAWGDDFWIPIAMHYRWNYPESIAMFMREAGDNLLPFTPRFIKNMAAQKTADTLIGFLPSVGVRPEQHQMIEAWTVNMLNTHFESNLYLLGNECPTIGDFSLMGPLYAHLHRDAWPRDNLMKNYPHLQAWVSRMLEPRSDLNSDVVTDSIPETLIPILRIIFKEFTPMLQGVSSQLTQVLPKYSSNQLLSRQLSREDSVFPMGSGLYKRKCNPFSLWKAQLVLDELTCMDPQQRLDVSQWLGSLGGDSFLQLSIPRLERVGLKVRIIGN
jgi:glutathione S-transferase